MTDRFAAISIARKDLCLRSNKAREVRTEGSPEMRYQEEAEKTEARRKKMEKPPGSRQVLTHGLRSKTANFTTC